MILRWILIHNQSSREKKQVLAMVGSHPVHLTISSFWSWFINGEEEDVSLYWFRKGWNGHARVEVEGGRNDTSLGVMG